MRAPQERGLVPEQSASGSVPLDVVRQVVREEIAPLARDVTQLREEFTELRAEVRGDVTGLRGEFAQLREEFAELREDFTLLRGEFTELRGDFTVLRGHVAQLAEGQMVLLEDMAEIKQVVRGHEARITALERGQL